MLYVAKEFTDGMIGRASMPLSSIDSLVWKSASGFLIASVVALLLALALAGTMARRVLDPLAAVGNALTGALSGASTQSLEAFRGDDELRPILRYIDKLVERLSGSIQNLTAERDKVNLILDCMDEGFLLLDESGGLLASNRAARALFGVPEDSADAAGLLVLPAAAACGRPPESVTAGRALWCWMWTTCLRQAGACAFSSPRSRAGNTRGKMRAPPSSSPM